MRWLVIAMMATSSLAYADVQRVRITAVPPNDAALEPAREPIDRCLSPLPFTQTTTLDVHIDSARRAHVDKLPTATAPWQCTKAVIEKLAFRDTDKLSIELRWELVEVAIEHATGDVDPAIARTFEDCMSAWSAPVHVEIHVAADGRWSATSANKCAAAKRSKTAPGHAATVGFDLAWQEMNALITAARADGAQDPTPPGPTGKFTLATARSHDATTLSAEMVVAKIVAAYVAQMQRCYRQVLDHDPTARGRLAIELTVNDTGRTVKRVPTSFSRDLDDCIARSAALWRFPVPKDAQGDPVEASFTIAFDVGPGP